MSALISPKRSSSAAFTIIELLTVISLVLVVMMLVVPSVSGIVRAGELANSASTLVSALSQARQNAIVSNRNVEVRLYRFRHPVTEQNEFQALQSFTASDDIAEEWVASSRIQRLPNAIIYDSRSTLIQGLLSSVRAGGGRLGSDITSYDYVSFTFRPDGSTSLGGSAGDWYILLRAANDPEASSPLPSDFFVVEVVPRWGQVKLYGR